jgi:hypothetical protein
MQRKQSPQGTQICKRQLVPALVAVQDHEAPAKERAIGVNETPHNLFDRMAYFQLDYARG